MDRDWTKENPAKKIKLPRNLKPNEVVPYTPAEITAILMACDRIGKRQFERLRARAMILTFRHTALRIGDVAMLARDRISPDGEGWRMFLRTEKSGQSVFLPVPKHLKEALDRVPPPVGNIDSRYFFWNGTGKQETHKGHMHRLLQAVFKKSGVAGAHAHRFRHTLATELLGRGASFEDVADILGNSPVDGSRSYRNRSGGCREYEASMKRARFGHRGKFRPQVTEQQQDLWRRERDSDT
jgi:integrase